jgi:hypothetical protein
MFKACKKLLIPIKNKTTSYSSIKPLRVLYPCIRTLAAHLSFAHCNWREREKERETQVGDIDR